MQQCIEMSCYKAGKDGAGTKRNLAFVSGTYSVYWIEIT